MRLRLLVGFIALIVSLSAPLLARAGMTVPTLADIPRILTLSKTASLRLDAISFFIVCLLAAAWAIQRMWNSLASDFPRLPRISYLRSFGLMGLWGLLFLLVLTMISGARELMTPGAWKKNGISYQLNESAAERTAPLASPDKQERP